MLEETQRNESPSVEGLPKTPEATSKVSEEYKGMQRTLAKVQADRDTLQKRLEALESQQATFGEVSQKLDMLIQISAANLDGREAETESEDEELPKAKVKGRASSFLEELKQQQAETAKKQAESAQRQNQDKQIQEYYKQLRKGAEGLIAEADLGEHEEAQSILTGFDANPVEGYQNIQKFIAKIAKQAKQNTPTKPSREDLEAVTEPGAPAQGKGALNSPVPSEHKELPGYRQRVREELGLRG